VTSEGDPTSVIFQTLIDAKANTVVIPDCGKMEWLKVLIKPKSLKAFI
jgi:hypothetical protein